MSIGRVRSLAKASSDGLTVNYSPRKAYTYAEQLKINGRSIVDSIRLSHKLEQSPANVLRWSVMTNTSHKSLLLASQRNRLRRQWTGALRAALRNRGMNPDGSPLAEGSPRLVGTLELVVFKGQNWGEPAEKFLEDTSKIVDALLKQQCPLMMTQERSRSTPRSFKRRE